MPKLTTEQGMAMIDSGFRHGFAGYPVLWADNGNVTIVEEKRTHLTVWEFFSDGSVQTRSYIKGG
jgi:hypothetical protein